MSADNWAFCPRCLSIDVEKQNELQEAARNAYGKVSAEEYLSMLEASKMEPSKEPTLREDYEIETDELGEFHVNYGCSCDRCGFHFEFKYEEQLKIERKP